MNHAGSDRDFYTVLDRGKAKQTITGDLDEFRIGLSTFKRYADYGIPQALEAMFSPVAEVDYIADFRHNYYIHTANTIDKYVATMLNFSNGEFKQRRHALRLGMNLSEALDTGRFQPRLTDRQKEQVNYWANHIYYFQVLDSMIPYPLDSYYPQIKEQS